MTIRHQHFHQTPILSLPKNSILDYSMSREKKVFALLIFLIAGLLLTSCTTSSTNQFTPDVNSTIVAQAQTIVVELNQTGTASIPITMTPPLITLTPLPTSLSPTASVTASPTSYTTSAGCNNLKMISASTTATNPLMAGQSFNQSWQIENNGTCSWDQSYHLVLVSGEKLGTSPSRLNQVVPPGKSINLSLELIAPNQDGVYNATWRFSDAKGTPFGETLSVSIAVRNSSESTPNPDKPNPAQTTAYVQTVIADQATAGAGDHETAVAQMTSSYATVMSSMYETSTAIAATNEAIGSATPQP